MRYLGMLGSGAPSVGVYDKTKISTFGRVFQKSINSKTVYGPGLTRFIDVQTDFAGLFTLSGVETTTANGRKFVCSTLSAGLLSVALYETNFATGAVTPRGRIVVTLPNQAATTAVPRFIQAVDTGTTGWKLFIGTVASVVPINGGVFCVNKVDLADFSFSVTPTQFYMAQASDAKAVYMLQDPTAMGAAHVMTTLIGGDIAPTLNQLLTLKGTAASASHDGFSTNVAPTWASANATMANGTASVFTINAHGYNANDMVIITANAPTGFTASGAAAVQTVYFVRNPTANTFELSATSGGASILGTSVTTPTIGRAFGTSTNLYVAARKTATITTGYLGTALLVQGCQVATPTDGINAGALCFMLFTTSNFYCWPVAGITAGATTMPLNLGINILGNGIDYVAPAATMARYSEVLGKIIFTSAAFAFYGKSWVNSAITHAFGTQISQWLENNSSTSQAYFRGFVVTGLEVAQGWIFATINTTGQRGILMVDGRSDHSFGYSYLTSPVQDLGAPANAKFVTTLEQLFEVTDTVHIFYRTAATASDAIFSNDSNGWTEINSAEDLNFALLRYVQVKVGWDVLTFLSGIPTQLQEVLFGHDPLNEMSMFWKGLATGTTDTSPSYTVYRQIALYGSVPTWYHRAFDDAGSLVESFNTVTDVAKFSYSTDEGVTWTPGVGPDQVGKRLRFARTNPPNVILTCSLKES